MSRDTKLNEYETAKSGTLKAAIGEAMILGSTDTSISRTAYQMGLGEAETRAMLAAAQTARLTEINKTSGAGHPSLFKAAENKYDQTLNHTANLAKHSYKKK